jgi:protein arginine kinase activator
MNEEEVMCDACGEERAVIHLTEMVDGEPVQKHLCQNCYQNEDDMPQLSSSDVFSELIQAVAPELQELSSETCPECGTNYLEFRQTMKLGCPHDYDVFADALDQLLERIHGATEHVGKMPKARHSQEELTEREKQTRIEVLQRQMQRAVQNEDYEQAAELRDQIEELKENGTE